LCRNLEAEIQSVPLIVVLGGTANIFNFVGQSCHITESIDGSHRVGLLLLLLTSVA